jgi:hypothetical protein
MIAMIIVVVVLVLGIGALVGWYAYYITTHDCRHLFIATWGEPRGSCLYEAAKKNMSAAHLSQACRVVSRCGPQTKEWIDDGEDETPLLACAQPLLRWDTSDVSVWEKDLRQTTESCGVVQPSPLPIPN